ncbi:uncharacterized protein G6M90_00g069100 [Metarhizium brunneum]|uniref:Enterotoxin n=1 Tax=Metarhizium brunneum TaxID=500148 RepID=A0A7D5UZD5_9HYPO
MARKVRPIAFITLAVSLCSTIYAKPVEILSRNVSNNLRGPEDQPGLIDTNTLGSLDKPTLSPRQDFPPPQILPPPQIVYRGDKRSPDEIRATGGFLPSSDLAPTDENNGFSLYMHHTSARINNKRVTSYVSTTRYFGTGLAYANQASREGGWLYQIQALPHMVDSDGTLLQGRKYRNEYEFSALGGIRWDQVKAAVQVPGAKTSTDYKSGSKTWTFVTMEDFNKTFPEKQWVVNTEYNSSYDQFEASPGQPQLAGWFQYDYDEDKYKSKEPWSQYQAQTVRQYFIDFMNQVGGPVGWTGTYPLVLSEDKWMDRARL